MKLFLAYSPLGQTTVINWVFYTLSKVCGCLFSIIPMDTWGSTRPLIGVWIFQKQFYICIAKKILPKTRRGKFLLCRF